MKRSKRLVTVFALVAAAAVVPTFAQARPNPTASNDRAHEIPYLSHGVGVDDSLYQVGAGEIPYLSHGVGVDKDLFAGSAPSSQTGVTPDDRALPRSTVEPTPIIVTKESGWSVDFGNPGLAALALMLGLLAGGTAAAMWSRRSRLTLA